MTEINKDKLNGLAAKEADLAPKIEAARRQLEQAKWTKDNLEEQKQDLCTKLEGKGYSIDTAFDVVVKQLQDGITKCDAVYKNAPIDNIIKWKKDESLIKLKDEWLSATELQGTVDEFNPESNDIQVLYDVIKKKNSIVKTFLDAANNLYGIAQTREEGLLEKKADIVAKLKKEGVESVEKLEEYITEKAQEYEDILNKAERRVNELSKFKVS